jgi:hypothetical protein
MDDYSRSSNDEDEVEPGPRISAEEKRSALLTVALEHNLINLLTGCVTHWNDGDLHFFIRELKSLKLTSLFALAFFPQ